MDDVDILEERRRSDWVRLRTLVILRWFACAGQVAAICVAWFAYDLRFEIGLAVATVGASVITNLFAVAIFPKNRRLSEREAAMILVFDIVQLALLLGLTGGLNNPFALLLLAPVTIAATVLHLRSTVVSGAVAIVLITVLWNWNLPMLTPGEVPLVLPPLFLFGFWVALVTGVAFLAVYARQVTTEMHTMGEALLATQMALNREQRLTALGGVVAAAAHELGTPLATIKLAAAELADEAGDRADLRADAELIGEQAERCREILLSMGRVGKDDLHLRHAPLAALLEEAAEPHLNRGIEVTLDVPGIGQPVVARRPEIVHGLRNLIQNAVDFATEEVRIEARWTEARLTVRIEDDGAGFPQSVLGRIGDPHLRRWRIAQDRQKRPGYGGMGLGLFIAKTLLERSGARIVFANGDPKRTGVGAIVVIDWPRSVLDVPDDTPLGDNIPLETRPA